MHVFLEPFLDAIWMDFGIPDPRKWSSRAGETLILIKSPSPSQGRVLMQNVLQTEVKVELKSDSKSIKKVMHFFIEIMLDFW